MTHDYYPVTEVSMRTYLLTWLMLYGTKFIDLDATVEVDDSMDDFMTYHWMRALDRGYIYNAGYTRTGEVSEMTRLTKKGLALINKAHDVAES